MGWKEGDKVDEKKEERIANKIGPKTFNSLREVPLLFFVIYFNEFIMFLGFFIKIRLDRMASW